MTTRYHWIATGDHSTGLVNHLTSFHKFKKYRFEPMLSRGNIFVNYYNRDSETHVWIVGENEKELIEPWRIVKNYLMDVSDCVRENYTG